MKKILYIILLSFIVSNCSIKPVVQHHGVPSLEKKQASLKVNKSNKNDIRKILGSPSTTSKFNNDIWIYIERKQTQSKLKNLGKMKIFKNDVLVLEIDNYGILKKKEFYNIEDMKNKNTEEQRIYIWKELVHIRFLSSMRQKINDPLGRPSVKKLASDNCNNNKATILVILSLD